MGAEASSVQIHISRSWASGHSSNQPPSTRLWWRKLRSRWNCEYSLYHKSAIASKRYTEHIITARHKQAQSSIVFHAISTQPFHTCTWNPFPCLQCSLQIWKVEKRREKKRNSDLRLVYLSWSSSFQVMDEIVVQQQAASCITTALSTSIRSKHIF